MKFDPQSENIELYSMGFILKQTDKTDEAWNFYNQSLEIPERITDKRGKGFTTKGLSDLVYGEGKMTMAKGHLEQGLEISRRIKDPSNEGVALKALGDWAWQAAIQQLLAAGGSADDYEWYLQLRERNSIRYVGFGMGFERLVQFIIGSESCLNCIEYPCNSVHYMP